MEKNYRVIKYTNKHGESCVLRPSEEQLRIIVSDMRQDQKIIACAGSGKTTTLVARLKFLIDNGVNPKSIIISTFNVEAGRHIMNRVIELVGEQSARLITIGNIDKIAFRLYCQYIRDNTEKSLKQFGLSVKEYCFELFKFLQTREGIKHVLDKYKYFFFDEFQDVNQLQYDILMLFKRHGCFLVVIGDDAQNIYGWRDSRIDIIQSKIDVDIKRFQGTSIKTYMLSTNYRCSKPITLFSNEIIIGSQNLIQKNMRYCDRPFFEEQNKPYLQCYKGLYIQNDSIIMQIKKKLTIYQMRDIAILCPTNQPLKFLEEAIEKHNQQNENEQIVYTSLIGHGAPSPNEQTRKSILEQQLIDRITLSTIHRAKGLEWKVVFFIGVNDEFFPTNFIRTTQNQPERLEESRRLFYVGCTRAINELYFSMTKNNKCHKVCRFFSTIQNDLYEKDIEILDTDINYVEDTSERTFEKDISVKSVIEKMDHSDFESVDQYLNGIQEAKQEFIHGQINLDNTEFNKYNLYNEFSLFMSLYIQRTLAEKLGVKEGFSFETGRTVLFSMFWRSEKAEIIAKYSAFFSNKSIHFDEMISPKQFVDQFNLFNNLGKLHTEDKATQNEENILEVMFVTIKSFTDLHDIPYHFIQHICVEEESQMVKEYFPEEFDRSQFVASFRAYCNPKNKTSDIVKDVYMMSKCPLLLEQTRKVLYRNDFEKLNSPNLEQFIGLFVDYLYSVLLKGNVDLIADSTIFEIKTSQYQYISKEYILQVLANAALLQLEESKKINTIVFYNPLLGKISVFDITQWNFATEFIEFLVKKSCEGDEVKQPAGANQVKQEQPSFASCIGEQESVYAEQDESINNISFVSANQVKQAKSLMIPSKPLFNLSEFSQPSKRGNKQAQMNQEFNQQNSQPLVSQPQKPMGRRQVKSRIGSSSLHCNSIETSNVSTELEEDVDDDDDDGGVAFLRYASNIAKKMKK